MNAWELFVGLMTSPIRLVKIARDYERREVRQTAVGWNPAENLPDEPNYTKSADGVWRPAEGADKAHHWTYVGADKSPSGEVEYYQVVRKP